MCPDWIIAEVQDQFHSTLNDPWTYWREADKIKSMKMKTYLWDTDELCLESLI